MTRVYTKNIREVAAILQECGGTVRRLLTEEVVAFAENIERNGYLIKFEKIAKTLTTKEKRHESNI